MNIEDKIYVAGHRGLVDSAIVRALEGTGFKNIVTRRHAARDCTNQGSANQNLGMGEQKPATKSMTDLFRDADEIVYENMEVCDSFTGLVI